MANVPGSTSNRSSWAEADVSQLPHPPPTHNLRDQMADAGILVQAYRRRPAPALRFFGGAANNPFLMASSTESLKRSQQAPLTSQQNSAPTMRSSSPNFPASTALVSAMVREHERWAEPLRLLPFDNTAPPLSSTRLASDGGSRLSPGSSRFRTRPVFQMEFGGGKPSETLTTSTNSNFNNRTTTSSNQRQHQNVFNGRGKSSSATAVYRKVLKIDSARKKISTSNKRRKNCNLYLLMAEEKRPTTDLIMTISNFTL